MNHRDSERDSAMGERLSRYLDGELNPAETRQVERLLETSVEAREMYEMLQEVHALSNKMMPHTYFSRPSVSLSRRWLLTRIAAALVLATVLGGLSYAAVQAYVAYIAAPKTAQETTAPSAEDEAPVATPESATPSSESPTPLRQAAAPPAAHTPVLQATASAVDSGVSPLTGVVEDVDGAPIRGAEVRAVGWSEEARQVCQNRETIMARTHTDESGHFSLDWPPEAWEVRIAAHGFVGVSARYTGQLRGASVEVHARLRAAPVVSGRVTNKVGMPISSVRVIPSEALDPARDTVLTDDNGEFSIATDDSTLLFQYPAFAIGIAEEVTEDTPVKVTLNRGATVVVRVVRAGIPVPGAVVTSNAPLPPAVEYDIARVADDRGQVRYERVPGPLFYEIVARTADWDAAMKEISVLPGQTTTCTIELPERYPGLVQGAVVDAQGQPVAFARVMIEAVGDSDKPRRLVPTAADGSFRAGLDYGDMRVSVNRPAALDEEVDGESQRRIEVTSERTSFYEEFRYKPATRTVFALKHAEGQPVTEADMMVSRVLEASPLDRQGLVFRVRSDDGRFQAPRQHHLLAWAYDPASRRAGSASSEEPVDKLDIVLEDAVGSVAVRVIDAEGHGLRDVRVAASRDMESKLLRYARGYTDKSGLVRLEPLADGQTYSIFARADGYQLPSGSVFPSAVASSEPAPVPVVLAPMSSGLMGRVTAMDGTPAQDANVTIIDDNGRLVSRIKTDEGGGFTVDLASGTYVLYAYARPFLLSEEVTATAPSQGIQLVLPTETIPERPPVQVPEGPEHAKASNNLKHMGLVCKMFANESLGEKFPPLDPTPGVFLPEWKAIYPEYLTDRAVLFGNEDANLCYFGYAVLTEDNGIAFLDAYETLGPEAIHDQDIQVLPGKGTAGTDTIHQLNEGLGQVFFGEASPVYSSVQADIPVMWEVPGDRQEPGGWVLFMDGHTEWMPYPGPFPMTEAFTGHLREIMGLEAIAGP